MTLNEILTILKTKQYMIYGCGFVASIFYRSLEKKGLLDNFEGFITTEKTECGLDGSEPKIISEIKDIGSKFICIAVHESIKDEIESYLSGKGLKQFCWIYPMLHEFMFGEKVQQHVLVDIKKIVEANKNYLIASRYAALEEYYGEEKDGYSIYIACMELSSNRETAKKRLEKFLININDTVNNKMPEIVIDTDYRIIDGTHRLAYMIFNGQKMAKCIIYKSCADYDIYINDVVLLNENILKSTKDLKQSLEKVNCRIKKKLDK